LQQVIKLDDKTEQVLNSWVAEKGFVKKDDLHQHDEPTHTHATRSHDKFCPTCGDVNSNYKKPDWFCNDCDAPIGTTDDMNNAKKCYNCGGQDAISQEDKNKAAGGE
tara:strand:+ start:11 stop:331 length:321 start_codon:yes stop_codon:yes gene_type:complete